LILLDTNVVIDAQNEGSPFYTWSNQVIAEGISTDGVGINTITLAELCSAARADSEKEQLNTQGWIYDCASPRLYVFSAKGAV
jgi:predicted nucleic acid-binding protein